MDNRLPIDVVPGTAPPLFYWRKQVSVLDGVKTIGFGPTMLPSGVGDAVLDLVNAMKRLMEKYAELQKLNEGLAERVAAQSELLSKKAEKPARGKG